MKKVTISNDDTTMHIEAIDQERVEITIERRGIENTYTVNNEVIIKVLRGVIWAMFY